MGLIGIGPAIGVGYGAGIGSIVEKKERRARLNQEYTKEETEQIKKRKKIALVSLSIGAIILTALVIRKFI